MYYNITSGEKSMRLPEKVEVGGKVVTNPSLKDCALVGWREMPEVPKAEAGMVITGVSFVQDSKDPLKVEAVVTKKSDAEVAQEQAIAQQEESDRQSEREARWKAQRDEITKAFDGAQAEAIGRLFDLARGIQ